ncbi:hypothetical protein SAMN05444274_1056 [Mariniphaga anaerophila]|uniref:Uncharacterized protein n=1 Tax=Mariniphaga anaerophila TaxID=1484053 RepID=A0A1M5B7J2_9BACT|nr:hypothetical protein SAMN05444274_1056 [Mariniphaga anaerophila]
MIQIQRLPMKPFHQQENRYAFVSLRYYFSGDSASNKKSGNSFWAAENKTAFFAVQTPDGGKTDEFTEHVFFQDIRFENLLTCEPK